MKVTKLSLFILFILGFVVAVCAPPSFAQSNPRYVNLGVVP
jgi:hypothetical protein